MYPEWLTCLRFFATGSYQQVVGDLSGISVASVSRIVKRVSHAIASLKPIYVRMPSGPVTREAKLEFSEIARFPGGL